jgi:hypothetical protein
VCALAVSCAWGAWSQDLTAARACARITGDAARLACYDTAFAASPAARDAAQSGDKGELQPEHKPKAAPPKTLIVKVQSAAPMGRGLYRLTLENGQIWETRQADWALDFKSSDMVTISRMALDTYQISLVGQGRSIGVRRIQ